MAVQLRSVAKHEVDERAEIKRLVLKANKDLDLAGSAGLLRTASLSYCPMDLIMLPLASRVTMSVRM